MAHHVRLFVGHPHVLARFRSVVPDVPLHSLSAGASLAVLSLSDQVHDALHAAYGTGEWIERGATLTTTDHGFAAATSMAGALAFIETDYFGGSGAQCAVLWRAGALTMQTEWLDAVAQRARPPVTWPINVALRALGLVASAGFDEFATFGLTHYRSHEAIIAKAMLVRV